MIPCRFVVFGVAVVVAACSSGIRSSFLATDPSFTPSPGATPMVYLDPSEVPRIPLRSVGIIEVTVPGSSGVSGAVEAAAAKGREIGCAMLVEHSVFDEVVSRARGGGHGATFVFAHGGGPEPAHHESSSDDGTLTAEFDCVVRADERREVAIRRPG